MPTNVSTGKSRRIVILNRKGGVGKTTTTINLAHALARRGRRICVVDCDGQRSATRKLLGREEPYTRNSILEFLDTPLSALQTDQDLRPFITMTNVAGVDLIAGHADLDEWGNPDDPYAALQLRLRLAKLGGYDYILFDTGPSWGLPTRLAFCAASEIIITAIYDDQALQGIKDLSANILKFSRKFAHEIRISMVVPIQRDMRYRGRVTRIETELERMHPQAKAPAIRTDGKVPDSGWMTIFTYAPKSKAAEDYDYLAERLDEVDIA